MTHNKKKKLALTRLSQNKKNDNLYKIILLSSVQLANLADGN